MIYISMYIPDKQFNEFMCKNMTDTMKKLRISATIRSHFYLEGMEKSIEKNDTDIYVLDFSNTENSTYLAEKIRNADTYPAIIFLHIPFIRLKDYLYLRPSACVETAEDSGELLLVFSRICKEFYLKQRYFHMRYNGDIVRVPFSDICSFESNAKMVTLNRIRDSARYHFTAKLSDIESTLPDRFVRCHQSYIVNMEHIARLDRQNRMFILQTKEQIYISRRMFREVSERYETYLKSYNR